MTLQQYKELAQCLHVSDEGNISGEIENCDCLYKLRPVVDTVNKLKKLNPGHDFAVDESQQSRE
jgi:hypothetical protein